MTLLNSQCIVHRPLPDDTDYFNELLAKGGIVKYHQIHLVNPLKLPAHGDWRLAFCDIYLQGNLVNWFTDIHGIKVTNGEYLENIYSNIYSILLHYQDGSEQWIKESNKYPKPLWL